MVVNKVGQLNKQTEDLKWQQHLEVERKYS